jgi:co-chaperonin GroES (HSP10)
MNTIKNVYHIDIDDTQNWAVKLGDTELYFDPEYHPEHTAIQWGTVKVSPKKIANQDNMLIPQPGDTVYFHHHVYDNVITYEDEKFRWSEHRNLFFMIKDDQIHMLNNYVLVRPKYESDDDIKTKSGIFTKANKEKIPQRGYIVASPVGLIDKETEIAFADMADYSIDVKGEEYYIMELRDIIAIIKDEVAEPVGNWSLIEPLDEGEQYTENEYGVFVPNKVSHKKKHQGKIVRTKNTWLGIKDGDTVIYDRRAFYAINVNNQKLYGVNTENDIFILL